VNAENRALKKGELIFINIIIIWLHKGVIKIVQDYFKIIKIFTVKKIN
jgi:hypothetical protein